MKRILLLALLVCAWPAQAAQIKARPQPGGSTARSLTTSGTWFLANGGRYHAGDPAKPAVLMFHGLHQSANSFLRPGLRERGDRWFFNHAATPPRIRAEKETPNTGIFKVGTSERLDVDPQNWFDFLKAQGFTVATWTQGGPAFADAYPTAVQAFEQFLTETAALNPASPPPVVLLGHSRGGLVIRQLLKEHGARNRVSTVITLHSPHHGSSLADRAEDLCDGMFDLFSKPGKELEKQMLRAAGLHDDFRSFCEILGSFVDSESRELAPGSTLITGLAQNETALPGVKYYTFGGTSPTYVRYYAWYLTPNSAVPQYRMKNGLPKQYFIWEANASEIPVLSPLFDASGFFAAEVQPGKGDGLVTDQSARLPFSTHYTTHLNHAEVLWDRRLQQQVLGLILGPADPRLPTSIRR